MTFGLHEVLQREIRGEHDAEHDRRLGEPAVAEGDDHGQAPTEKSPDVGDVAADEVHDHDGEHERQAEQDGGHADDPRVRVPWRPSSATGHPGSYGLHRGRGSHAE
jgi:hypothetical protein